MLELGKRMHWWIPDELNGAILFDDTSEGISPPHWLGVAAQLMAREDLAAYSGMLLSRPMRYSHEMTRALYRSGYSITPVTKGTCIRWTAVVGGGLHVHARRCSMQIKQKCFSDESGRLRILLRGKHRSGLRHARKSTDCLCLIRRRVFHVLVQASFGKAPERDSGSRFVVRAGRCGT